ncbi:MAG: hypothetical protein IPJ30_01375 [Acidobacteria bacterium]|nr:hypothetical protein [Acidobacteriota bacterium]
MLSDDDRTDEVLAARLLEYKRLQYRFDHFLPQRIVGPDLCDLAADDIQILLKIVNRLRNAVPETEALDPDVRPIDDVHIIAKNQ